MNQNATQAEPRIALIVPMLNEEANLPELLEHLSGWQQQGCELLLVDGGSQDRSVTLAEGAGFRVLHSARGRARQMNAGAAASHAEILLFLHADSRLPDSAVKQISQIAATHRSFWGRFDLQITGRAKMLTLIAAMINLRSRLTGIATGDQAIFVSRTLFEQLGGFPDQPLMEDVELSSQLKKTAPPHCLADKVITSGRRWEQYGVFSTILLMWQLRWQYWRGASPQSLAERYR